MTIKEINSLKKALMSNMKDYIKFFKKDAGVKPYSSADVKKCGIILDDYLSILATNPTDNGILSQVETTVKQLNELNEQCDYNLIETDEREQLCSIIIEAARLCGYQFSDDDDITAEWRDW